MEKARGSVRVIRDSVEYRERTSEESFTVVVNLPKDDRMECGYAYELAAQKFDSLAKEMQQAAKLYFFGKVTP